MSIKLAVSDLPTSTFTCGPSQGHPVIRQTPLYKTQFERSHRAKDVAAEGLYKEATDNLRKLLDLPADYTVIFFMGGATPALDAVAWSLTKDSISGLSFGAFSKLWCKKIAGCLEDSVKKEFREAAEGEFFPTEKPNYQASLVVLTPNETSTGTQIPNEYLEEAWAQKGPDTLVAWDCTSCAGGRDLPKNKFDVMVFSMQKCFGVGGGSSVIILSPKAVARIAEAKQYRRIPYSLDLTYAVEKAQEKIQTVNTPSTTNIWMFNEAAKWMNENGGLKAMDALCRKHADYLLKWAAQTDWLKPLIAQEENRSYTTLTLEITDPKIDAAEISKALKATGLPNLQDGIKKYSAVKQNSLRIACFPFVDINGVEQYEKLTHAVDEIVKQLRAQEAK
ncbi:MAG: aminotransferase class V-fold PLP-dependent enzyme [Elusimicrobiaceae bacterium]|nr:aminotransferase class V-fold PLP-dependent enzyme [Elusimicrobiaceae bacterium]